MEPMWVFLANDWIAFICLQLYSWGRNSYQGLGYDTDSLINPTRKRIPLSQGAITMHRIGISGVVSVKPIATGSTYRKILFYLSQYPTISHSVSPSDDAVAGISICVKLKYVHEVTFPLWSYLHF